MKPGQNSVERIRRHEVSRALNKVNLSPEEEEVIDVFSRSLVGRLLHGPISEVMERVELSFGSRPGQEAQTKLPSRRVNTRCARTGSFTLSESSSSGATRCLVSLHDLVPPPV
jgi:hypothetical protein